MSLAFPDDLSFFDRFTRDVHEVNGVRLHVVSGGAGDPVVLLHGFVETWAIWRKVMPLLAEDHHVIAPDLRGFGDSERTSSGYDKKTLAEDIAALLDDLGVSAAHVVGHDFGGQVAYRLVTARPDLARTLSAIESLLPGITVQPRGDEYRWWFVSFHQVSDVPEMLTSGREGAYIRLLFDAFVHPQNEMTEADYAELQRAYERPGALRAGFELYRTAAQDTAAFAPSYAAKLPIPVLALGGDCSMERRVLETYEQVAANVVGGVIERTAHFAPMERPQHTAEQLTAFFRSAACVAP